MLHSGSRILFLVGTTFVLLLACAPQTAQPPQAAATGAQSSPSPQKSLTIVFQWEPEALEPNLIASSPEASFLTNAFLAYVTPGGEPKPYLAAELPTVEKGTWKVLPDGTMETTYRLRPNAQWQDGKPVTAHDFVFAHQVRRDPAFPGQRVVIEPKLSSLTAVDDQTLHLAWREPFYKAGRVEPTHFAPMHRALLEPMFTEDKARFMEGPHWREQFVGSGGYRVERWDSGVEIQFRAHSGFVLGKPPIDNLTVRFIQDPNTTVANVLGGTVDAAFSYSIGFPHGQALEQVGWGGKIQYTPVGPRFLEMQTRDWGQSQRAAFDVRVRQAAHYAIDRASIVENIYAGKGRVAYFWLPPNDSSFADVDRVIRRYEFNPARAGSLLEEAGWIKSGDGMARNSAGELLDIPMQNQPNDFDQQEALVVADNWKAIGLNTDVHRLSTSELRDNQLRSTYAGAQYGRTGFTLEAMPWLSSQISRPENRWSGQNRSGYVNPVLEDMWPKVLGAVDAKERTPVLIPALQSMVDEAVVVLTHQQPNIMVSNADLVGPQIGEWPLWNVWEWSWK